MNALFEADGASPSVQPYPARHQGGMTGVDCREEFKAAYPPDAIGACAGSCETERQAAQLSYRCRTQEKRDVRLVATEPSGRDPLMMPEVIGGVLVTSRKTGAICEPAPWFL